MANTFVIPPFNQQLFVEISCCMGQLSGWYATDGCMGSLVIVDPQPLCRELLCLFYRVKHMQIQPFVTHSAVKPFDVGVLSRPARLNLHQRDPSGMRPGRHMGHDTCPCDTVFFTVFRSAAGS